MYELIKEDSHNIVSNMTKTVDKKVYSWYYKMSPVNCQIWWINSVVVIILTSKMYYLTRK